MKRLLPALFAMLLPTMALAQWERGAGDLGAPIIGGPLGNNDPADQQVMPLAVPSPPLTEQERQALRAKLVGKVVHGFGAGRIGEINDVAIDAQQRAVAVVIHVDAALDPDRANLAVPWIWVRSQLDAPVVAVPWGPSLVAWLTEPGRAHNTATLAAPAPDLRAAWQQQAAAELEQWRQRIDTLALSVGPRDPNLRQLRLSYGAARDRWDRLSQAGDDSWSVEQAKLQTDLDELRDSWSELAEAKP